MASSTFRVVDHEPRKTQQTTLVRSAASMRVNRISLIARSTKTVVSKLTASEEALGQLLLDLGEAGPHVAAHLHRVRRRAASVMPKPDGRLAQGAGEAAAVLEAVLDHRHVAQAHRGAAAVGDHEVAEGLDVDRLALGAHVHLALRRLDAAGGHLEVLALDRGVHVLRR